MNNLSNRPKSDPPAENIVIRGRNADDWTAVAAICRAQGLPFNPLEIPYAPDDHAKTLLSRALDANTDVNLVAELGGVIVGEILLERGRMARLRHIGFIERFVVEPSSHNRGIGSALLAAVLDVAENWLNLSRIHHVIAVDNAPAIALHRKHGFVIEGKLRDHNYRAGRYIDAYVMARIRE